MHVKLALDWLYVKDGIKPSFLCFWLKTYFNYSREVKSFSISIVYWESIMGIIENKGCTYVSISVPETPSDLDLVTVSWSLVIYALYKCAWKSCDLCVQSYQHSRTNVKNPRSHKIPTHPPTKIHQPQINTHQGLDTNPQASYNTSIHIRSVLMSVAYHSSTEAAL
jgi:hypothetical protein